MWSSSYFKNDGRLLANNIRRVLAYFDNVHGLHHIGASLLFMIIARFGRFHLIDGHRSLSS